MSEPKIAVLGTRANGAGIGGPTSFQAGLDVTFVEQWPAHVEAMRANGIRVEMPDETTVSPCMQSTSARWPRCGTSSRSC